MIRKPIQMHLKRNLRLTLVVSGLIFPTLANAEEIDSVKNGTSIEELIVTATKTNTIKREIPNSVSILDRQTLEQTQFQSIRDINAHIPNVYIPDFGSSRSTPIFIRGIGSRRVNMIGFYSNGIPLLDGESIDTDYNDLRSIEVLRGPQGTLYGRGAMGGIISITHHNPLDYQGTNINLSAGNYGLASLNANSYQKINDKWGVSGAITLQHKGGYYTNHFNNTQVDVSNSYSTKFGIHYRSNGWDINSFVQYQQRKQGGFPYAPLDREGNTGDINYNDPSSYNRNYLTLGLNIQKNWSNGLKLKSGSSFQNMQDEMLMDQDFTASPSITAKLATKRNTFTQEINLSQKIGRYTWVTGIYGFIINSRRSVDNKIIILPRTNVRNELHYYEPNSAVAIYHQSSYQITDRLTAELGLRYEWEWSKQTLNREDTNFLRGGAKTTMVYPFSTLFQQFTPKASLTYRIGKEHRIYASALKGYQSGGFNLQFDQPEEQSYKPEYSWNYELGTHLFFLGGRLQIDAAAFFINWEQQQITQNLVTQLGTKITNAGHSKSLGAELAIAYKPTDNLNLAMSYGYTKATFIEYDEYNRSTNSYINYNNNYIPQVPKQTVAANADYTFLTGIKLIEGIKVGVQYRGIGDIYWNSANNLKQNFYNILDAQVSFLGKGYSFELWAKNISNTAYNSYLFTSQGRNFAQKGTPSHMGATLRIKL